MLLDWTTDINETLCDAKLKDDKPLKTVERIKKILLDNGMETEEYWNESGVPYCYSVRISVRGTIFGTNGKGLTKEFALASGYGELMERLQLGHISRDDAQKDGSYSVNGGQDEIVCAADLLQRNRKWYEIYSMSVKESTGVEITPEEILAQFTDSEGNVVATPYFCVATQTKEYIPTKLRKLICTANGCASGNTIEEAIVQAFSEIVERGHKRQILEEQVAVPDIPEDVLKRYSTAYGIISYIRSKGFSVFVKDCSLGTKFPVVCVCFINQKNGKYHTHFGANPIFEIALERALTETFQGRNIDDFTEFADFSYSKTGTPSLNEQRQEIARGESKRLPEFFIGRPKHEWKETYGFSGQNNKDLLKECLDFFAEQGYDILIRDCSCLGFPTCQIIVLGYSELLIRRLSQKHNELAYAAHAIRVMRNPASANLDDILALIMHINQNKVNRPALKFSRLSRLAIDPSSEVETKIKAATMGCVYYNLGQFGETVKYIKEMLPVCEQEEQEYLICLERYLSMKQYSYNDEQIKTLLDMFHKPETVDGLYVCLEQKSNPLERFTLHCDSQCNKHCPLYHCCHKLRTSQMINVITTKTRELSFESTAEKLKQLIM